MGLGTRLAERMESVHRIRLNESMKLTHLQRNYHFILEDGLLDRVTATSIMVLTSRPCAQEWLFVSIMQRSCVVARHPRKYSGMCALVSQYVCVCVCERLSDAHIVYSDLELRPFISHKLDVKRAANNPEEREGEEVEDKDWK